MEATMNTIMKTTISKAGKRLAKIVLFVSVLAPASLPAAYATSQSRLDIGDNYGGGKVAYILKQGDHGYVPGETHGLIAAKGDLSYNDTWKNAVKACREYRAGGFSDWRLPKKDELIKLFNKRFEIGGFKDRHYYWSGTESDLNDVWDLSFGTGRRNLAYKLDHEYARPVRTF
jgi:hypothetical protein